MPHTMSNLVNNKNNRRDIQFLRAFAVLSVIFYHFKIPGFNGGFVGVDVFFVISGFLIFGQIDARMAQSSFSLIEFFEARLRRISPALVVMIAIVSIWGWKYDLPKHYIGFVRNALAAVFFVSNYSFNGAKGYFDIASDTKVLLHTWSLSVEAQFYVLLPLLLIPLYKIKGLNLRYVLFGLMTLSFFFALNLSYHSTPSLAFDWKTSGFYYVSSRSWEFLAGALVSKITFINVTDRKPWWIIALLGLFSTVYFLDGSYSWPNLLTLLPVGFSSIFILLFSEHQNNPVICFKPFQVIGDMSYSLYLWHWPVWIIYNQMYGNQINSNEKILMLCIVLLLSYFSWRFIELSFRNKKLINRKKFFLYLGTSTVAVMIFSSVVLVTKGYPKRFPDYVVRGFEQGRIPTPRNECFRSGNNTKKAQEQFCSYGISTKPEDAKMMLWGDSHANQYLSVLNSVSNELGQTGLIATMSGCRAFIENDEFKYEDYPLCKAFNHEVLNYLNSHPNIKTVILGRIWDEGDESVDRTVNLIHYLVGHRHNVILITPLPNPGVDVENDWVVKQLEAGHAIETIPIVMSGDVKLSTVIPKLRNRLSNELNTNQLYLLDPTQRFCDEKSCFEVRDGIPYFRDMSHLTELAAQRLEPDFEEALLWADKH